MVDIEKLDWEQIKSYWWAIFIQIKTYPLKIIDRTLNIDIEPDITDLTQLVLINLAFWLTTAILIWLMLLVFWKIKSFFR